MRVCEIHGCTLTYFSMKYDKTCHIMINVMLKYLILLVVGFLYDCEAALLGTSLYGSKITGTGNF